MESISGTLYDRLPLLDTDQTPTGDIGGHHHLNNSMADVNDNSNPVSKEISTNNRRNITSDDDDMKYESDNYSQRSLIEGTSRERQQQQQQHFDGTSIGAIEDEDLDEPSPNLISSAIWMGSETSIQSSQLATSFSLPPDESSVSLMSSVSLFTDDAIYNNICDDGGVLIHASSSNHSTGSTLMSTTTAISQACSTTLAMALTSTSVITLDKEDETVCLQRSETEASTNNKTTTDYITLLMESSVSESSSTSSKEVDQDHSDSSATHALKAIVTEGIGHELEVSTDTIDMDKLEKYTEGEEGDEQKGSDSNTTPIGSNWEFKFNLEAVEYVPSAQFTPPASPGSRGSSSNNVDTYKYEYNAYGPLLGVPNRVRCHQGRSKSNTKRRGDSSVECFIQLTNEEIERVMRPIFAYGMSFMARSTEHPVEPRIMKSNAYRIRSLVDRDISRGDISFIHQRNLTSYTNNDEMILEFMDHSNERPAELRSTNTGGVQRSTPRRRVRSRRGGRNKNNKKDLVEGLGGKEMKDPFMMRLEEVLDEDFSPDGKPHIRNESARPRHLPGVHSKSPLSSPDRKVTQGERRGGNESATRGLSTWSKQLREAGDVDILYKHERAIKALFNKLSVTNKDRIIYQKLASAVVDFLNEFKEDSHLHFSRLLTVNIINAVKNHPNGISLILKATLSLFYITTKWNKGNVDNFINESPLRPSLLKTLQDAIKVRISALNTTNIKLEPLEKINAIKDEYRALSDFSWALACHGILPNRVLRRMMIRLADDLEAGEIIRFDKMIITMQSSRGFIYQMGGAAFQRCLDTWKYCAKAVRENIELFVESWDSHSRAEASRLSVLLEIAEAESSLHIDKGDTECYPCRSVELAAVVSGFKDSKFSFEG